MFSLQSDPLHRNTCTMVIDSLLLLDALLTLRRTPGQNMNLSNAQGRLPVSLELVSSKIKNPVRYTIKFGKNSFSSILMCSRLRLLCCSIFSCIAEHINTWQLEGPIMSHCFSYGIALRQKSRLFHHVACQH